ncbi:3-phosphoshikimate 1-carboxyvinyltransferase [Heyndrickxia vini]|uniref:3-phosphoshikimate 1-carboxyvinyltransferase n=1 Tax=Heyndrickxia vini TaxID=1476025 RepID=A0ABX7E619_9BACI|nr:3-phosphoshikimate 1-carboxyvinyltransferase [Heyndrickxia vini]QQZ11031.1 3-phosphoshikimate 1-carboxyvinyltransferase [Heyndrickxia vini]
MNIVELHPANIGLKGAIKVPGDKSISHRAIMFGAIANGITIVRNFLQGADCRSTIECFRKLGVKIEESIDEIKIYGNGFDGLKEPVDILDVGNSGTTTRLILGLLAGRPFHTVIIGDESIAKRPMHRVTLPLQEMGAIIQGRNHGNYTPLSIVGGQLNPIKYEMPVASAQVKSALLLAALQIDGETTIIEPVSTRDHTERMIKQFGGKINIEQHVIKITGKQKLHGAKINVPGDISSAAFFMVAAALIENSNVVLENVGLNPTRIGVIEVLKEMGADIHIHENNDQTEPVGDITVKTSQLKGIEIGGDLIPRLIDELPIIALLATQAEGTTIIKNAEELKVKETNRIDTVVKELKTLGADIEATNDGMIIKGKVQLHGGHVHSHGDHRIGMMLSIASLISKDAVHLEGTDAINVSYPTFFEDLNQLLTNK